MKDLESKRNVQRSSKFIEKWLFNKIDIKMAPSLAFLQ